MTTIIGLNKKNTILSICIILLILLFSNAISVAENERYLWRNDAIKTIALSDFIKPPPGFVRTKVTRDSFAHWLRHIPIIPGQNKVYLYNGKLKNNQMAHFAVTNLDVGPRNLQQCADAIMRLRAEYLYLQKEYEKISFNFTNGFKCTFDKWRKGYRVAVNGNSVKWIKENTSDDSYQSFRKYLDTVFIYAGSFSLQKEMDVVDKIEDLQIGDVYINGGFPGHAVIILDVAENIEEGKKIMILGQSYMPAQNFHVLKNQANKNLSPWFQSTISEILRTPEWTFQPHSLHRFKN